MAKSLSSVTLSAPSSSGTYAVNATFTMTQRYALSGGGGAPTVDLHWQWDQGTGTWVDIPTSGSTGLVASGGSQSGATVSTDYSRTITCKSVGTYVIRAWAHASTPADKYSSNTPTITVMAVPTAPSDAHTDSKTAYQIVMHWTDNSNNESGFKIYKNDVYIETIAAGSTSYTFTGLDPNTQYDLAVKATNAAGDSAEAQLTETTLVAVGTTLFESQNTDNATELGVYLRHMQWQTFSPQVNHFIYSVKLTLKYHQWIAPWSGTLTVQICTTAGSFVYPKTVLASATMQVSNISSSATEYLFTLDSSVLLLAGTTYAIVVSCDAGDNSNWIGVYSYYSTGTDSYTRGKAGTHSESVFSNYYDLTFYTLDASDTVHESQTTDTNNVSYLSEDIDYAWQTFTASSGYSLAKVKLMVSKGGSPTGTWKVSLRATNGDLPSGADLASVSGDIATAWPASKTLTTFTFSSAYTLTQGTKYAIVVSLSNAGSVNNCPDNSLRVFTAYSASTDPYTGGVAGAAFHGYYGNYYDFRFKEYGANGELVRLNVGDVFKYVDSGAVKINIGDVWKQVVEIQINIGDTWKQIL